MPYEIKIKERLDDQWADWFEGFTFTHTEEGVTILVGRVKDQAALAAVLNHLSNLGLSLISVRPISTDTTKE